MQINETKIDPIDNGQMKVFKNDIYTAIVKVWSDEITQIIIHDISCSTEIPWAHKQQIKNDICGREREAIEIFPAMSRLVDAQNLYHLWVYPEGHIIPTGYGRRPNN